MTYTCPFCRIVVGDQTIVIPALRLYELHLDGHMARHDRLPSEDVGREIEACRPSLHSAA